MAIHNSVLCNGQVAIEPKVGEVFAKTNIKLCRGTRMGNELNNIRYDCPSVQSSNPRILNEIASWKKGDMVEIKGVLNEQRSKKAVECPNCKKWQTISYVNTFISPIYAERRESIPDSNVVNEIQKKRAEVANSITVIGMVTEEPQTFTVGNGKLVCQYTLCVRRKIKVLHDSPDKTADFLLVKSYGALAEENRKAIKKGSIIFIEGLVQTISLKRRTTCICGNELTFEIPETSVVPYAVEYLHNINEIESLSNNYANPYINDKLPKEKVEKNYNDVLPEPEEIEAKAENN